MMSRENFKKDKWIYGVLIGVAGLVGMWLTISAGLDKAIARSEPYQVLERKIVAQEQINSHTKEGMDEIKSEIRGLRQDIDSGVSQIVREMRRNRR